MKYGESVTRLIYRCCLVWEYYSDTLATATPAEAQKCLKDLLYSSEQRLPPHDSEQELADSFFQFFHSTALDGLQDQLPLLPDAPLVSVPELDSFRPVTQEELLKLVRMSASKTCMLDPASTALLKCPVVLNSVLPHMVAAINASLESAEVPGCLKEAVITPILKKQGLDADSIYEVLSACVKHPIPGQSDGKGCCFPTHNHLTEHGLHDPFQSAYRKGHRAETALLMIQDDMQKSSGSW